MKIFSEDLKVSEKIEGKYFVFFSFFQYAMNPLKYLLKGRVNGLASTVFESRSELTPSRWKAKANLDGMTEKYTWVQQV